jgi:hypothetical protein
MNFTTREQERPSDFGMSVEFCQKGSSGDVNWRYYWVP